MYNVTSMVRVLDRVLDQLISNIVKSPRVIMLVGDLPSPCLCTTASLWQAETKRRARQAKKEEERREEENKKVMQR